MESGEIIFEETQPMWHNMLLRVMLPMSSVTMVVTVFAVSLKAPPGQRPMLWCAGLLIVVVDLLVLVGIRLKIRVDERELRARLVPFGSRRIDRTQIVAADAVSYDALGDYGGWGIRRSRKFGKAYTVAGDRGVLLTLADGSMFLLGSRRSEELAAILRPNPAGKPSGI